MRSQCRRRSASRVTDQLPISLCDVCRNPGQCCKSFNLTSHARQSDLTLWDDEDKTAQIRAHGLPFEVSETVSTHIDPESGRSYSLHRFSCPILKPDGRCGDYANRPQLCRDYRAGSDGICAMFVAPPPTEGELKS